MTNSEFLAYVKDLSEKLIQNGIELKDNNNNLIDILKVIIVSIETGTTTYQQANMQTMTDNFISIIENQCNLLEDEIKDISKKIDELNVLAKKRSIHTFDYFSTIKNFNLNIQIFNHNQIDPKIFKGLSWNTYIVNRLMIKSDMIHNYDRLMVDIRKDKQHNRQFWVSIIIGSASIILGIASFFL